MDAWRRSPRVGPIRCTIEHECACGAETRRSYGRAIREREAPGSGHDVLNAADRSTRLGEVPGVRDARVAADERPGSDAEAFDGESARALQKGTRPDVGQKEA